jgi:hypothetical protein
MTATRKIAYALFLVGVWIAVAGYFASDPVEGVSRLKSTPLHTGLGFISIWDLEFEGCIPYNKILTLAITLIFAGIAAIVFESVLENETDDQEKNP